MTVEELTDLIAYSYIESGKSDGFNGLPAAALAGSYDDVGTLRSDLATLIRSGAATAVFAKFSVNMHIKRLPDLPIDQQVELVLTEDVHSYCLYPTAQVVAPRVDLGQWQDRPFGQALLMGEPQLAFRAFDMGALERYVADPRYVVQFEDYMGTMSITDAYFSSPAHPERDKVSLQTFGLGFDGQRLPYVVVYLRYLTRLSPEHQQYWNSYLHSGDVKLSEPYYLSSIEGQFWKNRSVRNAITEEIDVIRRLTLAIWGQSLFRPFESGDVPLGLTSFLRPTAQNFERFVMTLDKVLSESIDPKFFDGKIDLETETERSDGKVVVQNKGTLRLLEEWLAKEIVWEDPNAFRKVIIEPLRKVRRLRQKPAHTFTTNAFSADYREERKRLLWDVYNSLFNIRVTLSTHARAGQVVVPKWLDGEHIDVF